MPRCKYLDQVIKKARAQGKLKPGTAHMIDVLHDDWCDLLAGKGPCNCEPEVRPPKRIPSPQDN